MSINMSDMNKFMPVGSEMYTNVASQYVDGGIDVKKKLTVSELSELVTNVANMCVNNNEVYMPIFDTVFMAHILAFYAGVNPDIDLDGISNFINYNPVCNEIIGAIQDNIENVRDMCKMECATRCHKDTYTEAVCNKIINLIDSLKGYADNIDVNELSDLKSQLDTLIKNDKFGIL